MSILALCACGFWLVLFAERYAIYTDMFTNMYFQAYADRLQPSVVGNETGLNSRYKLACASPGSTKRYRIIPGPLTLEEEGVKLWGVSTRNQLVYKTGKNTRNHFKRTSFYPHSINVRCGLQYNAAVLTIGSTAV